MVKPEVFAQVNEELVRVKSVEDAQLYAFYFNEESGNLENVHLDSGIHALAERYGAPVTVNPMFPGRDMYECRVGNILYSQSVPYRQGSVLPSETGNATGRATENGGMTV